MYLDIENREEGKLTILYTLARYQVPLSMERMADILTWEKEIMEYFVLSIFLAELVEDGYAAKKFYRNRECYFLTNLGSETENFFSGRIPKSIRNRVDDAIGRIRFEEQDDPNMTVCEVVPIDERQYMARCRIMDRNVPMMDLQIHVGNRVNAEKVKQHFEACQTDLPGRFKAMYF